MTGLIGSTWKRCKAWSGRVLTAENLTSIRVPGRNDIHAHYAILRQHWLARSRLVIALLWGVWLVGLIAEQCPHGFVWW